MSSKAVDQELRRVFWPELKALGFRRTGRTAWRDRPGAVQTVSVQSFNSYLAGAIGATTFSFGVALGVFYPVIAEHSAIGAFVKDPRRPAEHLCHARYHFTKGLAQPGSAPGRRRIGLFRRRTVEPAWVDRPDVWYVEADGANLADVVIDARDRVLSVGIPWLDRLSDPREARRAFLEDESTNSADGIVAEGYLGAIGSPARWHAVAALSLALGDRDGLDWALDSMDVAPGDRAVAGDRESLRRARGTSGTDSPVDSPT
jgi:hypothetical protein